MKAKTAQEALVALQEMIDAGYSVECDVFGKQYQITIREHIHIAFDDHHHYLDPTFVGAVMKAHKATL